MRFARIILVAVLVVLLPELTPSPANAYRTTPNTPLPSIRIFYTVDGSFTGAGFLVASLHWSEQRWKINGLTQQAEFWNDPGQPGAGNRRVVAGRIDGPGPTVANADPGCRDNTSTCTMRFEPTQPDVVNNWNTTLDVRDATWLDFAGVAAHEFGHWLGINHRDGSNNEQLGDQVQCDNHALPTTGTVGSAGSPTGAVFKRTIQADDENALRAARPTSPGNIVANTSFEYQPTDWGGFGGTGFCWRRATATGGAARYCSGSVHFSCFIEFNNGNSETGDSSIFQDIIVRGVPAGRTVTPRLYMRAPNGSLGATIAVWDLSAGGTVSSRSVTVGTAWAQYDAPSFVAQTDRAYRFEIYNSHASRNLDIDFLRLNF